MVVDDAKCENCHSNLSLHGYNRHDANGYCQTCHMPSATDAAVRPAEAGDPQSIDFRYMIHKIHRGAELETGYVVYGYRSSVHDFSEVEYVGDLRNCDACHVDGSQQLPLPDGLESVVTPRIHGRPCCLRRQPACPATTASQLQFMQTPIQRIWGGMCYLSRLRQDLSS